MLGLKSGFGGAQEGLFPKHFRHNEDKECTNKAAPAEQVNQRITSRGKKRDDC
jgi:hypothetical protein